MTETEARASALTALVTMSEPIVEVSTRLRSFAWDSEGHLVVVTREHVIAVLDRFVTGELGPEDVEFWANEVEGRDDLGLEAGSEELLRQVIFALANPVLTEPITPVSALEWRSRLATGKTD